MRRLLAFAAMIAAAGFIVTHGQSALAAETYVLDKPHTQIKFSVDRGGWTRVAGWFGTFDGEIVFDEANIANSKVTATIDTSSINTGFERRDAHLKSPDFFNAQEFPEMTFTSTSIEKTGDKTGTMTGNLSLLGVTKPVTLDVTFNRKAEHPRTKTTFVGFSATGSLKRSDYGMKFLVPTVSDEVRIEIEALAEAKKG